MVVVPPIQGLRSGMVLYSQGVALGFIICAFQAGGGVAVGSIIHAFQAEAGVVLDWIVCAFQTGGLSGGAPRHWARTDRGGTAPKQPEGRKY